VVRSALNVKSRLPLTKRAQGRSDHNARRRLPVLYSMRIVNDFYGVPVSLGGRATPQPERCRCIAPRGDVRSKWVRQGTYPLLMAVAIAATTARAQEVPFVQLAGVDVLKGCVVPFQDSRGRVWLGRCESASADLSYFDGSRFISPLRGDCPKWQVGGFAEDSEGGIWISSDVGLYRFYKGRLQRILDGQAWNGIAAISPDVFLLTIGPQGGDSVKDADLVRISRTKGAWKAAVVLKSFPQATLNVDRSGHILYPCDGGFCELQSSELVHWGPGLPVTVSHHSATAHRGHADTATLVWRDKLGCVWMRTPTDASYQCPDDAQFVTLPASVASRGAAPILELDDGSVVIPSFAKIALGRPGSFRVLTTLNGYPSAGSALVARDGSILIGNANGLFRFSPREKLEFWTEHDGLDGNTWSVLPMGKRVFAISGDSIRVLDKDRSRWQLLTRVGNASYLIPGSGKTILVGSHTDGVVQISTQGKILRRSDSADVSILARAQDGQVWAAGSSIFKLARSGPRLLLTPTGAPVSYSSTADLKLDRNTGLWACYQAGLLHRERSGWHVFSMADGFLDNGCDSFAIDQHDEIWYAYGFPAFSLIPNAASNRPQLAHFRSGGELGAGASNFFDVDRRGWLWRGTSDGIYLADPEQARRGSWLRLDRADGLPAVDANQKSFYEDTDESVWFGADNCIVHMFLSDEWLHASRAPSIFVSAFSWDGGPSQIADAVSGFKAGSNIVAYIGSPQFDRRNALRLRYRTLPEQTAWRETGSLDLTLGKLAWGSHTIEVQGRIFTGPWSETISRSFTVLPPVGLTWPFLLAYLALGISLPFGCYALRRRQQAEEAVLLPDLAAWRMGALIPEAHQLTGTVLDSRFEVGDLLARGGFANVMSGFDRGQQQRCAIKVFRNEVNDNGWVQRRFEQEVTALQQVRHPNVVAIYAHGVTPTGSPYLVMEFVEGKCLREVLGHGALTPARVAKLLLQLAAALGAIHSQNIWHRDVKPENVMLRHEGTADEQPVLIDFSIAIVKDADATLHGLSRAAGTFDYMAPEQAIGYAQPSSDIYSLVKVTLEMLTGQRLSKLLPDAALDLPERVRDLARGLNLGLSEESIEMLARGLEFDPTKRPQAVGAFARPLVRDIASGGQGWKH